MNIIIGLGGNVGDVRAAFEIAVVALGERQGLKIGKCSSLYRTEPVGPDQPPFFNAAMIVTTEKSPRALLHRCLEIEKSTGRNRSGEVRWGPRTLDLDLLIADAVVCKGPFLELPHPRLVERAFALVPAAEIAPEWVHPMNGKMLHQLAAQARTGHRAAVEMLGSW